MEGLIARALGENVQDLFPERYDRRGNRLIVTRPKRATVT